MGVAERSSHRLDGLGNMEAFCGWQNQNLRGKQAGHHVVRGRRLPAAAVCRRRRTKRRWRYIMAITNNT